MCVCLLLPFLNQFPSENQFLFLYTFPSILCVCVCARVFYEFAHLFSCKRCKSPDYLNLITAIVIVRCLLYHFQHPTNIRNKIKNIELEHTTHWMISMREKLRVQKKTTWWYLPENSDHVWINSRSDCCFQMHCTHVNSIKRNVVKSTSASAYNSMYANGSTTPKQPHCYTDGESTERERAKNWTERDRSPQTHTQIYRHMREVSFCVWKKILHFIAIATIVIMGVVSCQRWNNKTP